MPSWPAMKYGGRRWRPFTLSASEYRELADDLVASHGFTIVDVPPWVTCHDDWHAWIMERRHGVPAGPQLRLNRRAQELTKQFEDAKADPGTHADQLAVLFLAAQRAKDDATHFADPWITAARFTKYRRTMRWLLDAKHRQQAAEMAGDTASAATAAVHIQVGNPDPGHEAFAWNDERDGFLRKSPAETLAWLHRWAARGSEDAGEVGDLPMVSALLAPAGLIRR